MTGGRWRFHWLFAIGFAVGVSWYDGSLWIQLGPAQLEIERV